MQKYLFYFLIELRSIHKCFQNTKMHGSFCRTEFTVCQNGPFWHRELQTCWNLKKWMSLHCSPKRIQHTEYSNAYFESLFCIGLRWYLLSIRNRPAETGVHRSLRRPNCVSEVLIPNYSDFLQSSSHNALNSIIHLNAVNNFRWILVFAFEFTDATLGRLHQEFLRCMKGWIALM